MLKRTILSACCAAAIFATVGYAQESATLTLRSGGKVSGQLVGILFNSDAQLTVGARLGSADGGAVQCGQRDRLQPARKPHVLVHRGHDADLGELVFVPGNEQHSLLGADVNRQGDRHIREDDSVVQWDEKECVSHARILPPDS